MAERTNPHAEIVVGAQDKATPVFDSIKRGAQGMATGVEQSANKAAASVGKIGDNAQPAAEKLDRSTKSIISSIQRATAQIEAGDRASGKFFETLAQQRGVNVDVLKPYLQQLDDARAKQSAASATLNAYGLSAKQTAAALRGVPAQITDIFVSLQGGQRPMTVLLQQGGQLKDMFGGVVPAAKALGSTVLGLVNPFTLAAAAAGGLFYAYRQGASEQEAFQRSLILSGNAVGASADSLSQMAAEIDAVSRGITRGRAAEALNKIAASGDVGAASLKRYAQAALEFEQAGGGAAEEVSKAFSDLAKDPVSAVLKLNESMNFLTASTYEQIKSLQDQGKELEAAKIAQESYAGAIESRIPRLEENLGSLERGWRAVKGAAAEAWDSMLGVGRAASLDEQIAALQTQVDAGRANPIVGSGYAATRGRAVQAQNEAALSALKEQKRLLDSAAMAERARAQQEKARIDWIKAGEKYLSDEVKKANAIAAARELGRKAGESEEQIRKRIAQIEKSFEKKAGRSSTSARDSDLDAIRQQAQEWQRYVESFNSAAISAQSGIDGLTKSQQKLVEFLQSPAYLNSSEPMRQTALEAAYAAIAIEQQAEAEKEAAKAAADLAKAREQVLQAQERSAATVEQQVQKLRDEEEALAISAAMNISMAEALEIVAVARLNEAKAKELAKGADADQAVIAAIEKEIAARKELASLMAKKEVREANKKAAEDAAKEWERTSNEISQALTNALMRGFEDGKSFGENFADSLGNSIKTAVARALQQALAKNISAMFGGQGGFNWSSLFSGNNWASTIGSALGYGSTAGAGAGTLTYANAVGAMGGDSLGALAAANNQWAGVAASASEAAAASQSAASASSAAAGAWAGWAAVALATSGNMYKAGWNKDAMTEGAIASHRFGRFSSTTGQSQYTSTGLLAETANVITEKINMGILKAVGTSDKWAQILSGVPLTAGVWGRKLKGYGYDVDIAGGAVDVGGYEYHKGGLFRSNKTIEFDVDPRDAEELRRTVENVRDSSAAMAKAMGYSDEAIESFTGNLRINFKGAETAAEQSERYNEALQDLNRQMINAATGANYTKEQFDAMMSGIQEDMAAVGISAEGIADILVQGMMGKLSQQEVGDALADMIVGGIYESIASNYAGQIAQAFTGQILTPMFAAMAAGVPLAQAINQQAVEKMVATAQQAAAAMNAIFSNAEFQAAISGIEQAIGGVAGAVTKVKIPSFGSARTSASNAAAQKAQQQAQERYNLETKLLQLLGKTDILRQRELASINAANRGLQQHIWAVEDATDSVNNAMAALERAVAAERDRLQEQLDAAMESERALNDVFGVLRDNIRDLRGEVESTSQIDAAAGRDLIQQAIAGAKFDADELADAIDAVRHSIEKGNYATRFDQERAQLKLAAELSLLSEVTESELSAAEQQIALLEDQLNGLDVQLDLAQQQIDALFGVDTSVKGVGEAVAALATAMGGYTAAVAAASAVAVSTGAAPSGSVSVSGGGGGGGGSSSKQWTAAGYMSKNPDLQAYWAANGAELARDRGWTAEDYALWHWQNYGQKENRKFARGGYYPGGLALVGEEGPELINFRQPGQVYTAMQTKNLLAGDGEVSRLLRQLIEETRSNAAAVVKRQVDLNKIVSRWDRDGMPEERDVTA